MIDWLFETLFAVTALMLVVLAVRRPVANLFGAGWAYALWLLPRAPAGASAAAVRSPPNFLFRPSPSSSRRWTE